MSPHDLAAAHLRLARHLARKHAASRALYRRHADAMESAAMLGLWEAAAAFPGVGSFPAFAATVIVRRLRDECRAVRAGGFGGLSLAVRGGWMPDRPGSLDAPPPDGREQETLGATLPDRGRLPVGWEAESEDEVLALTGCLPPRRREVMRAKYLHAATAESAACASALGVSPNYVDQTTCLSRRAIRAARRLDEALGDRAGVTVGRRRGA